MIDKSLLSVIFVMFMVVLILSALILLGSKRFSVYFWPLLSFASLLFIVALVLVLIK